MGERDEGARDLILNYWSIRVHQYVSSETLRGMSLEGEALWFRLGADQWIKGAASADVAKWRRAHSKRAHAFEDAWAEASSTFEARPEGLVHPVIAIDRAEAIQKIRDAIAAGRNAANVRWAKHRPTRRQEVLFGPNAPASPPGTSDSGSVSGSDPIPHDLPCTRESPESAPGGSSVTPAQVDAFRVLWLASFKQARRAEYVWSPDDAKRAARLLSVLTLDELGARMVGYLQHPVFGPNGDLGGFEHKHNIAAGQPRDPFADARERARRAEGV